MKSLCATDAVQRVGQNANVRWSPEMPFLSGIKVIIDVLYMTNPKSVRWWYSETSRPVRRHRIYINNLGFLFRVAFGRLICVSNLYITEFMIVPTVLRTYFSQLLVASLGYP